MAELTDIRDAVRERYAAAARAIAEEEPAGCGCGCGPATTVDETGASLYDDAGTDGATASAVRVINLAADKPKVLAEAARVLRPGGRLAVADIIADPGMDEATRADMAAWTGCIAGALTEDDFRAALAAAGLADIDIRETHRVHEYAGSAIVRARKP